MIDIQLALKLIALLSDGKTHLSEYIAASLETNKETIDAHIQTIRMWGVEIFTDLGNRYTLQNSIQLLKIDHILEFLEEKRLTLLPIVDSTNQYLMNNIYKLHRGDACISEYQNKGRGRRGRQWISPFGANLYLSMFWILPKGPAAAKGLSLVIGIVIAEVLQGLGVKAVRVKWPNDVYLNNRKLAGILVELRGKVGDAAHLVIGVGINLAMRSTKFNIINQEWITLKAAGVNINRNELAATLLNKLRQAMYQFESHGISPFMTRWHLLDNFIDQPIKVLTSKQKIFGISRGINREGALLVEQRGIIKPFIDGEISLRSAES